ncbi:ACP S-malonyltransferase [Kutzneria chonburiensis]|uniref:Malonyl CoA-acyl carrier protein transacylase n=1 Tax=Kutzneria chonburiensis TaxID=1483604 RepID=A0ABV6N6T7_9PSEU|nr:ACP S-malonyltransferase [Kutzneria chonburiensis]
MPRIYLFAGQGAQKVGMGREEFERFPELEREASEVLGYSVRTLCLEDPDLLLGNTRYTQPAMFVVNALAYRAKVEERGRPELALGHSLGEYNALEAAGAFSFADGLRLVAARAAAMARITGGGMTVVAGLGETQIRFLLLRAGFDTVELANLNTPQQTVLAGPVDDLEEFAPILEDAGARMVRRLPVSGPFHSRHMTPAAQELAPLLRATTFNPLAFPVIANLTAQPYTVDTAAELLIGQIDGAVRWSESLLPLVDSEFVEVGGTMLTSMVRQIKRAAVAA